MTDEQILTALDMRDHQKKSSSQIAAALRVSRGTILGQLRRIDEGQEPCACQKPENRDGGMPRMWWTRAKEGVR